ncbi:MAG: putative Ig domain-containing protein [Planctomycetota bacterium]
MLRNFFERRGLRRRGRKLNTASLANRRKRRLTSELLEARALLAVTPLGDTLAISNASQDVVATDVAINESGSSILAFQGHNSANRLDGNDRDILIQMINSDGTVGNLITVNESSRGDQSDPVLAADGNGDFLVVWSGRGQGDRVGIFGQRFTSSGTAINDQFRINTTRGGDQVQPAIAMSDDGRAVVVWHGPGADDASGIWMQRIAADGTLTGDETLVNTTTDGKQAYPAVGMDDDGDFVVAWSSRHQDGDDWGVFSQRFDASGNRQGTETQVNTTTVGSQHEPAVAMARPGEYAIAWSSLAQDGDSWGIFAQRFDASGNTQGGEFQVNDDTTGHQRNVDAAMADGGELVVTYNTGQPNGEGWEVATRTFNDDGTVDGDEATIDEADSVLGSGHQQNPAVAVSQSGTGVVAFDGITTISQPGVQLQLFNVDVGPTENVAPRLNSVDDATTSVGTEIEITVTADDENPRDVLTFSLDTVVSPDGSTIETDGRTATIRWTPTAAERASVQNFRVFVDDEGGLSDAVQFSVTVNNALPVVDLNGSDDGLNTTVEVPEGVSDLDLLDDDFSITDADGTTLASATIRLRGLVDGPDERITIDTDGTSITQSFNDASGVLSLTGEDTIANYESVIRTLRYENDLATPTATNRSVDITVDDGTTGFGGGVSELVTITVDFEGLNEDPTLAAIEDVTVLAGSPLFIPLVADDADGDALSFTASAADTTVLTTDIPEGNRSLRFTVEDFGDMTFELYDHLAPRATNRIAELAEDDFYDGITLRP